MSDYEYDSSDSDYNPGDQDPDYYSDDEELIFEAEGVSDEEVIPEGEEDPLGFKFVVPLDQVNPDYVEIPDYIHENAGATRAVPPLPPPVVAFKMFMDH